MNDDHEDHETGVEQCNWCGCAGSASKDGRYVEDAEGTVLFVHANCA